MYTEYEKYMAIKYLVKKYVEYKREDFTIAQNQILCQAEKTDIRDLNSTDQMLKRSAELQNIQEEFWYGLRIMKEMDNIIGSFEPTTEDGEMTKALEKHAKENSYSHIIEAMAYYFLIEHRFPTELQSAHYLGILGKLEEKIYDYQGIEIRLEVINNILLKAMLSSQEFQNLAQGRQLTK